MFHSLWFSLLLCHCSHLTDTTIIKTITVCSTQLFAILLTTETILFTSNFTQRWLNSFWLLPAMSCLFICAHLQSTECCLSRRFAFSTSRELYRNNLCMCILILVCPFFPHACWCHLIWKVFDVYVSVYLCIAYRAVRFFLKTSKSSKIKKNRHTGMFCKSQNFKSLVLWNHNCDFRVFWKSKWFYPFENTRKQLIFCLELITFFTSWKLVSVLVKISREN